MEVNREQTKKENDFYTFYFDIGDWSWNLWYK